MGFDNLREWMEQVDKLGELKRINGANAEEEIGGITDIFQHKMETPALLFDEIPGFEKGYRVLANTLTSTQRIALTLGLPLSSSKIDIVNAWRKKAKAPKIIASEEVTSGPVMENVLTGDDVNMLKFPTPKWHELDGGRYIGTGCVVIMKDPDSNWINLGVYRGMVHDEKNVGLYISPGKHGVLIRDKYWSRGEPCPVAVSAGQDPLLFMVAGMEIPYGVNEYEYTGGLRNKPYQVVKAPATGLPVPAHAEIVYEGFMYPNKLKNEGPFGEWPGYYCSGVRQEPYIVVKTVLHRNDPIIVGSPPAVPPSDAAFFRCPLRSAIVWDELEKAGIPGIKGVWAHEAGGGRMLLIISIEQMYAGHSRQAGLVASQCHGGAYANHAVIVVDDDIDPTDNNQIFWAFSTRVDPVVDVEILRRGWSTPLDPMSYPPGEGKRFWNNRMVIDACRPWDKRKEFPAVARNSKEFTKKIKDKWAGIF